MYVRGIIVFLLGLFFIGLLGTNYDVNFFVSTFYDAPTTLAFIIIIAAVIVISDGYKTFVITINALLSKKYSVSAADKEKAINLLKLISKSVNYASGLIVTMGLILMLHSLSDPASLGPQTAIAINAIFQGIFINLVFVHPAIHILKTRYNTEEKTVVSEKQVIDKLLELCYKQGISPEEIINADEIHFGKR